MTRPAAGSESPCPDPVSSYFRSALTLVLDRNGGGLRAVALFSRHKDIRTLSIHDDNRKDLAGQMADLISEE